MKFWKNIVLSLMFHAENTNVTGDSGMSVTMKTYYDKVLLENAFANLVHNQFGQKRPIPKGNGKIVEFRKMTPLAKALTPLTESVTPNGQKIAMTAITATIEQYGAYVAYSDILSMTTIDPVLQETTELLGHQSGETLDTITREILNGGTSVQYGDGSVVNRAALVAYDATWANNDYFNCEVIRRAMLTLRNNKARPVSGKDFVCIIHPELEYCLKRDSEWVSYQLSQNADKVFEGEIGKFDGCRFVVSTEAKLFAAPWITAASKTVTQSGAISTATITIEEAMTAGEATAVTGRYLSYGGTRRLVSSAAAGVAGAATITFSTTPTDAATGAIVYPADMGKTLVQMPLAGAEVGTALFLGANAYGVTEVSGLGLETIHQPLGSAGSADPLKQRGTMGWKASHVAKRLAELWMLRVEVTIPDVLGAN